MRNVDFARQPARLLLIAMMTAALAAPQAARQDHAVLDEIRAHHSGIAVWWVGNAGWLIKSGDLVCLVAFGAGLTWGSVFLRY